MIEITGHFISAEPYCGRLVEFFLCDGELHREDGPAWIRRDAATGVILAEQSFIHGELHSIEGNASHLLRRKDGMIRCAEWHRDGVLHRPTREGPAREVFDEDGRHVEREFWVLGMQVPDPSQPVDFAKLLKTAFSRPQL